MRFEREINIFNDNTITNQFTTQNTSIQQLQGKISAIISDEQITEYADGTKTVVSDMHSIGNTVSGHTESIQSLTNRIGDQGDAIESMESRYNTRFNTLEGTVSTVGTSVARKNTVFSTTPTVPYRKSDIWLNNGEVYRAQATKDGENDVFDPEDWVKATNYATQQFCAENFYNKQTTQSEIKQYADRVVATVQSNVDNIQNDLGNYYYTVAEVEAYVENELSGFRVKADNIDFSGYSFNLTAQRTEIHSDKFSVYSSGVVKAKALQIDGKYTNYFDRPYISFPFTYYGRHNNTLDSFMLDDNGLIINGKGTQIVLSPYLYGDHDVWTDSYGHGHEELFQMYGNGTGGYSSDYGMLAIADNHIDFNYKKTYDSSSAYFDYNDSWICAKSFYGKNLKIKGGSKNKVIATENYGDISMYSYETASPMYGDIGEGQTDETGVAYVYFDPKYLATVKENTKYQVFLQKYGEGDLYVAERHAEYFVVKGTPNTEFGWESKHYQGDLDFRRTDNPEFEPGLHSNKEYDIMADRYIKNLNEERTNAYEQSRNISDTVS